MHRLFVSLLLLTSCGYQWQQEGRPTVSVPFIKEDEDGALTTEIISTLGSSGLFDVVSRDADYRLDVQICSSHYDQIGYRRDPQKIDGKVKKNLLAAEGRKIVDLNVTLYRGAEVAYGPYKITAEADYDYVDGDSFKDLTFFSKTGSLVEVLPFSLGQLEPIESAQAASSRPLYRKLSQKIVDVISAEW